MTKHLFCRVINSKGSVITKRRTAKNLGKFMTDQEFQDGRACFEKEVEDQNEIKFLTWDIVGQFNQQKIKIHCPPVGKIEEIL